MPIVGTAGHVDHGKSTLVQALTGRDPDRWQEEKRRGLTIDLGFAWTRLGNDTVGFVDVPGHERFIKNMLAGVGGLDVALFVVAADEGWMPQSEEHLAVLDLLDVEHGVIALSRVDVADEDMVAIARMDVEEHVEGTVAEPWPIVDVAAPNGTGVARVAEALEHALALAGPPRDLDRPKMWIDRAFAIAGAGIVVTGTLVDGSLSIGDLVECFPGGPARIRGLQSHELTHDTVGPGTRTAVNLVGQDRDRLDRGTLLALPDSFETTSRVMVRLRYPPRAEASVDDRGAYHLHTGTATAPARIKLLEETSEPAAVVSMTSEIPLAMTDRFIVRDTGRRQIVAGGIVLDPLTSARPSLEHAARLSDAIDGTPRDRAAALVDVHGSIDANAVRRSSGGGTTAEAVAIGTILLSAGEFARLGAELEWAVDEYHRRFPLRPGLPKSEAASRLTGDVDLVSRLTQDSVGLIEEGPIVRRTDFRPVLAPSDAAAWESARAALAADLAVPRASTLGLSQEVLHALVRRGDLVRIAEDHVMLPDQVATVTSSLSALGNEFTVAAFRDEFGLARRQAVPLLEWLDAEGWTRRRGDVRTVRRGPGKSAAGVPSP